MAHHFFASSVSTWMTDKDVASLIARMKRDSHYPFTVWYVPLPASEHYDINFYQPVVDGCIMLALYTRNAKRKTWHLAEVQ